ncbi:MAG TPA: hypothetical protein VJ508_09850, partial [Saprospiraceae bacterium]|nr:hypothetical protein [Saprospiraceae bacterium]
DVYLFILRLIHILSAVFWGGGLLTLSMFILPSVNSSMPEAGKFMQRFLGAYHFPIYMTIAGSLTVLSGVLMYADLSRMFSMVWISSAHGLCLTVGGTAGIIAFLLGLLVNKPRADRMGRIGKEIMQAGGKPTEAQVAEMTALRMAITSMTKNIAILILIAIIAMASAKYVN